MTGNLSSGPWGGRREPAQPPSSQHGKGTHEDSHSSRSPCNSSQGRALSLDNHLVTFYWPSTLCQVLGRISGFSRWALLPRGPRETYKQVIIILHLAKESLLAGGKGKEEKGTSLLHPSNQTFIPPMLTKCLACTRRQAKRPLWALPSWSL